MLTTGIHRLCVTVLNMWSSGQSAHESVRTRQCGIIRCNLPCARESSVAFYPRKVGNASNRSNRKTNRHRLLARFRLGGVRASPHMTFFTLAPRWTNLLCSVADEAIKGQLIRGQSFCFNEDEARNFLNPFACIPEL